MTKQNHNQKALEVRQALWALQKEVLTSLKEEFEREAGYTAAPTEWFKVLTTAERYMWLRELTSLMADIDVMTELESVTDQHASAARAEIERLLLNEAKAESEFTKQYVEVLRRAGSLLPLHSHLKSSVQHLPKVEMTKDQSLAERKSWHEEHRHQARKKRN